MAARCWDCFNAKRFAGFPIKTGFREIMKNKTLNHLVGIFIKFLHKFYKPEYPKQPMAFQTNIGKVVVQPKEGGGWDSHIPGHKYPFPGLPDERIVGTLDIIKRMFPIIYKWAWVIMRDRLPQHLLSQSQDGRIGLVDPSNFSRPVRELHRALTAVREKEGEEAMRGKWTELRDILCLHFEFDDTYRFRLQEFIQELKKEEFDFSEADTYWAGFKFRYFFNNKKIAEMRRKYNIPWTNNADEKEAYYKKMGV